MITALVIVGALAGIFAGLAAHQRRDLAEAKKEIAGYRDEELVTAARIASLEDKVAAHETSLSMIMGEVIRADNAHS